jgi:hypothetical protein
VTNKDEYLVLRMFLGRKATRVELYPSFDWLETVLHMQLARQVEIANKRTDGGGNNRLGHFANQNRISRVSSDQPFPIVKVSRTFPLPLSMRLEKVFSFHDWF